MDNPWRCANGQRHLSTHTTALTTTKANCESCFIARTREIQVGHNWSLNSVLPWENQSHSNPFICVTSFPLNFLHALSSALWLFLSPAVGPGAFWPFVLQLVSGGFLGIFVPLPLHHLHCLSGTPVSILGLSPSCFPHLSALFANTIGDFSCIFLLLSLSPCVFVCVCIYVCDFSVSQSLPLHLDALFSLLHPLGTCCSCFSNCSLSWWLTFSLPCNLRFLEAPLSCFYLPFFFR